MRASVGVPKSVEDAERAVSSSPSRRAIAVFREPSEETPGRAQVVQVVQHREVEVSLVVEGEGVISHVVIIEVVETVVDDWVDVL